VFLEYRDEKIPSYIFPMGRQPYWARVSTLSRLHDHTQTHHIRYDFSGRVISPIQRPLPDNTQHSQYTNIHAAGGIRTRNLNKRAAADRRLRPRCHWDRHRRVTVQTFSKRSYIYITLYQCNARIFRWLGSVWSYGALTCRTYSCFRHLQLYIWEDNERVVESKTKGAVTELCDPNHKLNVINFCVGASWMLCLP
jgi:hypothetical protein